MKKRRLSLRPIISPFDDVVFHAYAQQHGVTERNMPADAIRRGWNGNEGGRRDGLPEAFPEFTFHPITEGVPAGLVISLPCSRRPIVKYGRNPASAYLHIDARSIPETLKGSIRMRRVDEIANVAGIGDWIILKAGESSGTLTLSIHPKGYSDFRVETNFTTNHPGSVDRG